MNSKHIVLADQPAIDLIGPIKNLSADITTLDLAVNKFGSKNTGEIVQVLAAIPDWVTSLNLSCNNLFEKNIDEIIQILAAIPKTIRHLDLGGNFYNQPEKGIQTKIFAAIPSHVISLCLTCQNFGEDSQDLAQAFAAFGPNLLALDLFCTKLDTLSLESLKQLKNTLPHLRTVYLEHDEIFRMGPERARALNDVFPNVDEIIVLDSTTGTASPDKIVRTNLLKKLGFKVSSVPSLVNQCAFFVNRNADKYDTSSLPIELQEKIASFSLIS